MSIKRIITIITIFLLFSCPANAGDIEIISRTEVPWIAADPPCWWVEYRVDGYEGIWAIEDLKEGGTDQKALDYLNARPAEALAHAKAWHAMNLGITVEEMELNKRIETLEAAVNALEKP